MDSATVLARAEQDIGPGCALRTGPPVLPFPVTGRPVLWWPRPRRVLVILVALMSLLGFPPAAAAMPATQLPHDWIRPAPGEVIEEFAAPPAPWAAGHRGVDLAVAADGLIRSPAAGVISFSGRVVNREVLSIDHGAGLVSSFEPVSSELAPGDSVARGEVIAHLDVYDDGSHHCATRRVHWGVRLHGEYINPLLLTRELEPSVLLPLAD